MDFSIPEYADILCSLVPVDGDVFSQMATAYSGKYGVGGYAGGIQTVDARKSCPNNPDS